MSHCFQITSLLLMLALFSGCTRKVEVEAFIVTKGGESVKLGLVEIRAIPFDDAMKALQPVLTKRVEELGQAKAAANEAKEKYAPIKAKLEGDLQAAIAREPQAREAASNPEISLLR